MPERSGWGLGSGQRLEVAGGTAADGTGEVLREGVRLIDKAADLADEAPGLVRCLGFRLQGGLLAADGGGQGPGQGLQLLAPGQDQELEALARTGSPT